MCYAAGTTPYREPASCVRQPHLLVADQRHGHFRLNTVKQLEAAQRQQTYARVMWECCDVTHHSPGCWWDMLQ
eukprot:scaffold71370_cov18-Tisochrysis_lutea.AAC.1